MTHSVPLRLSTRRQALSHVVVKAS